MKKIHLNDVLRIMDEKSTPHGDPIYHSISFCKYSLHDKRNNGEMVHLSKVQKCGQKFNMKDHMRIGLVDVTGKVRNCHIRLITQFNKLTVVW